MLLILYSLTMKMKMSQQLQVTLTHVTSILLREFIRNFLSILVENKFTVSINIFYAVNLEKVECVNQEHLKKLTEMGFTETRAIKALRINRYRVIIYDCVNNVKISHLR